jgi:hypothetical protein
MFACMRICIYLTESLIGELERKTYNITYCVLRIAYYNCVLHIAYCVLRIAYVLRTAYCVLRIAYCVLQIAYKLFFFFLLLPSLLEVARVEL